MNPSIDPNYFRGETFGPGRVRADHEDRLERAWHQLVDTEIVVYDIERDTSSDALERAAATAQRDRAAAQYQRLVERSPIYRVGRNGHP